MLGSLPVICCHKPLEIIVNRLLCICFFLHIFMQYVTFRTYLPRYYLNEPQLRMSDMFLRSSLRNESEEEVRHAVRPQLFEGHLISFEV